MSYILFSEKLQLGISIMISFRKFELTAQVRQMNHFTDRAIAQKCLDDLGTHLEKFKQFLPIGDDFNPLDFAVKEVA